MKRFRSKGRYLLAGLLALAIIMPGWGCAVLSSGTVRNGAGQTDVIAASAPSISAETGSPAIVKEVVLTVPQLAPVIESVKPSVVAVGTTYTQYMFRQAFTQEGAGSGWIVDEDGLIVTNYHVVEDADSITVMLEDGSSYPGEVVGSDANSDLAIIKIEASNLPALKWGDSAGLRVGDWVVAMGNSLGMGTSATLGIVSARDISLSLSSRETLDGLIQTDAAINPGNSGGPLVNLLGQVIGINSVKVAEVGVEGMGYAIGTEEARPVIEELISKISG